MPSRTEMPSWIESGRIPGLDGLRAVAVVLVIVDHIVESKISREHQVQHEIAKAASDVGVDAFFVLSGFLITTMLCRELERTSQISLRTFYRRRGLRIFPAFLAFLAFVALLAFFGQADIPRRDWLAALTYTVNFQPRPSWEVGHLWSLSIEEHFYLLWPPVLAVLDRRSAIRLLGALLVLEPLARMFVLLEWPSYAPVAELWTFVRTDGIVAGCLLALVSREPWGVRVLDRAARRWPVAAIAMMAALAAGFASGKVDVGVTPTIVALSLAVLVWRAVRVQPRWLEGRLVVTVGVGSYSIYLWQQVFLQPKVAWWTSLPLSLGLVGLAAALSYRFVEMPFVRMKDRIATT
jgi:peptidoglycan/LPS O-acetylase OafA/YrhL